MAFDHKDTDALYEKMIEPLLDKKGISAFRVDRSNRNDDIDDQIIAELGKCDFVIADLTYARPSVYFEAGVAQGRPVPVIYTCREDHFKYRQDDEHGNFRIHFDLQMKPVIKWEKPRDMSFFKKLTKRLGHVIRPLLRQKDEKEMVENKIAKFGVLPLNQKTSLLWHIFANKIRRQGFKYWEKTGGFYKILSKPNSLRWVETHFADGLSKKEIGIFTRGMNYSAERFLRKNFESEHFPRHISSDIIFCSIQPVPVSRISSALPNFRVYKSANLITAEGDDLVELKKYPKGKSEWEIDVKPKIKKIPHFITVNVIAGVKHEEEFKSHLKEVLE
jgi:nucleoside 2-deoxyribosyltransferase